MVSVELFRWDFPWIRGDEIYFGALFLVVQAVMLVGLGLFAWARPQAVNAILLTASVV